MRGKVLIGGAGLALCAALGLFALSGSQVKAVAFDQVPKQSDRVQVYGRLDKTTIQSIRGANVVTFELLEEDSSKPYPNGKQPPLTGRRLKLVYDNATSGLPANFPTASHVRAHGQWDGTQNRLVTDTVYTKCPSKYVPNPLDTTTTTAVKKWLNQTGLPDPAKQGS